MFEELACVCVVCSWVGGWTCVVGVWLCVCVCTCAHAPCACLKQSNGITFSQSYTYWSWWWFHFWHLLWNCQSLALHIVSKYCLTLWVEHTARCCPLVRSVERCQIQIATSKILAWLFFLFDAMYLILGIRHVAVVQWQASSTLTQVIPVQLRFNWLLPLSDNRGRHSANHNLLPDMHVCVCQSCM